MDDQVINLIGQMGMAGIFAAMWYLERRRVSQVVDRHIQDLREIANLGRHLHPVQQQAQRYPLHIPGPHDTKPLPPLPADSGD